jgi:cyclopropane fatty-acyl-phospholipid synthase-like methyltransferase
MADTMRDAAPLTSADVAEYYDRNTGRFLLMSWGAPSVHRALWGPGVDSVRAAVAHVDTLVAEQIAQEVDDAGPHIVDFGCGVGGTLFHLARRFPQARLTGLTVSRRQVRVAERSAFRLGLAGRCTFSVADFQVAALPEGADAIVAVESFVHSASAERFLANAARHLDAGAPLVVVDDFLASDEHTLSPIQRRRVEEMRSGWRVPSLCTVESFVAAARRSGFDAHLVRDLTPLTRPGSRVRDRLTAAVSPLLAGLGLARIPLYGNMIGGNALQVGLREGFLVYHMLVLRKRAE